MRDGFIKVATATSSIRVADCDFNAQQAIALIKEAIKREVALVVFPELNISGSTCGDLFWDPLLQEGALKALKQIVASTVASPILVVVSLPLANKNSLYNCAVVIQDGAILAVIPKEHLTKSEKRWFSGELGSDHEITILDNNVLFTPNVVFNSLVCPNFSFAVELGDNTENPFSPSVLHVSNGSTIIVNPIATSLTVGSSQKLKKNLLFYSKRLKAAYLTSCASLGESTTDSVFGNSSFIVESGKLLNSSEVGSLTLLISEIDVNYLASERQKSNFIKEDFGQHYHNLYFDHPLYETALTREVKQYPFIPTDKESDRYDEIYTIQVLALAKRMTHVKATKLVLGISGGLDSTLALIAAVKTFDYLKMDRQGIIAITMPCFGTTQRTLDNAIGMAQELGVTFRQIDISKTVLSHFEDIGHSSSVTDVVYENAQARERTQVLMDVANKEGTFVLGTGDLSELALGWATFNGDHMSMYAINGSVPKTLIRPLIEHFSKSIDSKKLKAILDDVNVTVVSPELLPVKNEKEIQATEEIVGPYVLHDFFLYHLLRRNSSPKKIVRLATYAFKKEFSQKEIVKWLKVFYSRFFSQQFKRSSFPDGPKIGSVSLSVRLSLNMPSDATSLLWLKELEELN